MDVDSIRSDFPTLSKEVNGQQIAYLDSAATTQKPQQVINAISEYYAEKNANVHRCVHSLGESATDIYDTAHMDVARFIGADNDKEIVFTKNATEALNLVAYSYGMNELESENEILVTAMDHHAMIVPWQQVAEKTGATLRYVNVTEDGKLDMEDYRDKLSEDTAVVGAMHASNVLGTVNPIKEMAELAHDHDAVFVCDGAQSAPHMDIDVNELDVDFFAFSAHKMCGPTGIGVLYGKQELLEEMDPFMYGGDMISRVSQEGAEWNKLPMKFEAGTPPIAQAAGLSAAIDYLESIGIQNIHEHGTALAQDAKARLDRIDGVTTYGPEERTGLVSFTVENAHPHDLSTLLNEDGIAIRGGHHCAQPLSDILGIASTARASFYLYNTENEVDRLITSVKNAVELFN